MGVKKIKSIYILATRALLGLSTFFVFVDLHGPESGLEVVEEDEDRHRDGQDEANEEQGYDGLSRKIIVRLGIISIGNLGLQ